MIEFVSGNLLDAKAEALVNTVNTVGVMGKGIALMFKETYPDNFKSYVSACKRKEVVVGRMFVTERQDWAGGPRWIINFPTKVHWRNPSRIGWIEEGLVDLKAFIIDHGVRSVALPPLGSGNGGLNWSVVRPAIETALGSIEGTRVLVYEPTPTYQTVAKAQGVTSLTPARALIAELVRRYSILGFECTLLEIHKLAYLLEQHIVPLRIDNPLELNFKPNKFGPHAQKLDHLLNGLDGSYLHCEKRVADAGPADIIWFEHRQENRLQTYIKTAANQFIPALDAVSDQIRGFESPVGLELLATVHWLLKDGTRPSGDAVETGLGEWLGGGTAAQRKRKLFDRRLIDLALRRLSNVSSDVEPPARG